MAGIVGRGKRWCLARDVPLDALQLPQQVGSMMVERVWPTGRRQVEARWFSQGFHPVIGEGRGGDNVQVWSTTGGIRCLGGSGKYVKSKIANFPATVAEVAGHYVVTEVRDGAVCVRIASGWFTRSPVARGEVYTQVRHREVL